MLSIYFNLAPRYTLQLRKTDASGNLITTNAGDRKAKFGFYMDENCSVPAKLWGTYTPGTITNEFEVGNDGLKHISGLLAGHTYYIRELVSPEGYPDVSGERITLEILANGTARATTTMSQSMVSVAPSEDAGSFKLILTVKNNQETSVTARKVWGRVDGREYSADTSFSARLKLLRYTLSDDIDTETAPTRHVRLVQQYYEGNRAVGTPVGCGDTTYEVEDGGTISFTVTAGDGVAVYSVRPLYGSATVTYGDFTLNKGYYDNGVWDNMPRRADFSMVVERDTVVYITYIGGAPAGHVNVSEPAITGSSGNRKKRDLDAAFNQSSIYTDIQDTQYFTELNISSANNWTCTWEKLPTKDGNGKPYYYYVRETAVSTPQTNSTGSFITTYSSEGLTSGSVTVYNILNAVKVKLRKRDGQTNVNLSGAEFLIYKEEEYINIDGGSHTGFPISSSTYGGMIFSNECGGFGSDGHTHATDSLGRFYTGYLPAGTYYLVEKKAPEGYNRLTSDFQVEISADGVRYKQLTGTDDWHTLNADSDGFYNLYIPNWPGYQLPATGGPGTGAFTAVGAGLMALALALWLLKRRGERL